MNTPATNSGTTVKSPPEGFEVEEHETMGTLQVMSVSAPSLGEEQPSSGSNSNPTKAEAFAESALGRAIMDTPTSASWTTLGGFTEKVARKLKTRITLRQVDEAICTLSQEEQQKLGIWRTSFGLQFQPILCVNPGARKAGAVNGNSCTCDAKGGHTKEEAMNRFFNSADYNAGRHEVASSNHKANCALWTPPKTSHLHSWRRGH